MKRQLLRFTRCRKYHEGNTTMKTDHSTRGKERLQPELFTHNLTLAHMKQTKKRSRLARLSALLFRCIFVVLVEGTVFSAVNIAHALPVSDRTPQVRDAIVAAVPGVNSASDVTEAHLAAITSLSVRSRDITALRSGDFDGLTALTTLSVGGTKLSSLPAVIFDNLPTLTELYLGGNNDLNTLPAGIFDNLTALKKLYLNDNGMSSVRSRVFDNLTALEELGLKGNDLRSLPSGIFDNLTALKKLDMSYNELVSLRSGIFDNNTALTELHLYYNDLNSLPSGIFDNNTALTTLTIWENNLSSLSAGIFDNNTALTNLSIGFNNFSSLPSGIFEKLTNLIGLGLLGNQFRSLPNGIFKGLPTLTSLNVSQNPVDPLPLPVSLQKVADGQFKAVAPTGAPFDIVLPLSVTDGSISGGATTLTIPVGSVESAPLTVIRTPGTTAAVTVNIGTLPVLPANHVGYRIVASSGIEVLEGYDEQLWSGTITLGTWGNALGNGNATGYGYSSYHNAGSISNRTFTYRGTTYTIHGIGLAQIGDKHPYNLMLRISPRFPLCDEHRLKLNGFAGWSFSLSVGGTQIWFDGTPMYNWRGTYNWAWTPGHPILWEITHYPTVPDAPVATATNEGNQVTLSWSTSCDSGIDITSHEYRQRIGSGTFGPWTPIPNSAASGVNASSYTVTNVNNPLESTFEVRAVNELGMGLPSAETIPASAGFVPVSERTPQVRDAIVARVPGVNSANDVTEAHLAAITSLYLSRDNITTLKAGDFDGLTALTTLDLAENQLSTLPEGIFDDLTALTTLELHNNQFTTLPADIFDELTKLRELHLYNNQIATLPAGTFDGLSWLDQLFLQGNQLTTLPAGIFDKLTALRNLNLENNQLSSLPEGIFDKLTELNYLTLADNQLTTLPAGIFDGPSALYDLWLDDNQFATLPVGIFKMKASFLTLRGLYLEDNAVDPLPLTVSLEKVANGQFKAVAPTGATFDFTLQISIANGIINGGATSITIPKGSVESGMLTVTRTPDTNAAVTIDIGTLPGLPSNHTGYQLAKSDDLPLEVISASAPQVTGVNIPDPNLRAKIEDALGKASGDPISAAEMATLTSLTAQDASISNLTGLETATNLTTLKIGDNTISDISALAGLANLTELQLWDNKISDISAVAGLTQLTKLYLWGNSISDIAAASRLTNLTHLRLGENSISNISALAGLTNLTFLSVKENSISDISAVAGLTNLTELVIGNNAIANISAVAKLTNLVWLDAPNNSISDISAVANLTNLTSLMLTGNTTSDISTLTGLTKLIELYLGENSILDLSPLAANTGLGANTEIDVRGNPLSYPSIYTHIPTLQARNVYVDFDNRVATAPVKISGDTQQGAPSTTLAQPFVVEVRAGDSTAFAGVPVTFAVTAGGGTLSVTSTTTNTNGRAESTLILGSSAGTNTVRVSVQGISQIVTFTAVATTTNTAPVFTDGTSTTRSVAENTATGVNIGNAIAATDADNDTLTYTLGGTDASSFSIVSSSGQLQTQAALDYETKSSYSVMVSVSDGNGGINSITVTINVTDVNEQQTEQTDVTTYEVGDEIPLPSGFNTPRLTMGTGRSLTADNGTYTCVSEQNCIIQNGQVTQGTIEITTVAANTAPVFTDGTSTTRSIAENTAAGVSIGTAITATDTNNDILTYTLGGTNAASFGINSTTGQLRTRAALDYETKRSYTVTVTVSDGTLIDTIAVTIIVTNVVENTAPVFTEGTSTTRSVAENTATGVNIGSAIAATDADNDTLTYTLGSTNAALFGINSTTGQLRTRAVLDYETKRSYTVTVTVSDGSFTDTITVTVNVTDVADTPVVSTLTPVCDRTPQVRDAIVASVRGVGDCKDVTDAHLAAIRGLLDLRNKNISALKPGDFDGLSSLQDIRLDRNQLRALPADIFSGLSSLRALYLGDNQLTSLPADVFSGLSALTDLFLHENRLARLPVDLFAGLSALRQINLHTNRLTTLPANVFSGLSSLTQIYLRNNQLTNLPPELFSGLSSLQYLYLDNNRFRTLPAGMFTGLSSLTQLLLNNNRLTSLPEGVFRGLTASTWLWLQGNTVDPLPLTISLEKVGGNQFKASVPAGAPFTIVLPLRVVNGAISGGANTLTIPQGSVESGLLTVTRTTGTTAAVTVDTGTLPGLPANHQGYQLTKSTNVPVEIISAPGNRAPIFTEGASTPRAVAENTASGVNIGAVIAATDPDNDTLTYTLSGSDAASFSIHSSTGQLQTKSALNYETKTTYIVTVTVSDGSLTDTIAVTINVTDTDESPTDTGICQVGDILAPGESCTYPDTDATFSVLDNGHARWNIPGLPSWLAWANQVSIGGSLSFTATINDEDYHFVAEEGTNDSWEIKEIGDSGTQQPDPPEEPEEPEGVGGTPTLSASTAAPLTEATLDGNVVMLRVTGGIYKDNWNFVNRNVKVSGIAGVTFSPFNLDIESDTEITVELDFDGTDFDANSTLTFTVEPEAMVNYTGPALTAQISVTALTESVVATTAAPLTEATLHESVVTLTLNSRSYESSRFTIRDAVTVSGIAGVTVGTFGVDRVSDTTITVELTFDGNINMNGTLTFTVGAGAIAGYDGAALTAQVPVSAGDPPVVQDPDPPEQPITTGGEGETPTFTASTTSPLAETTLHESIVTLTLSGRVYEDSSYTVALAITVSGIDGATFETWDVDRISDTEVTVELTFDGDFDTNATLTFTVEADAITDYDGTAFTAQIPVTGGPESIAASTVAPLTEATLHESVVTLTLSGRVYEDSSYTVALAITVSGIDGATFETWDVDRISGTEVTVELTFDGNFDTDSTLTFTVGAEAIADYDGPALTAQIPVTANTESVAATTVSSLTEATLDESVITLALNGANYERSIFDIRDAVTVSGIAGVTVGTFGVRRVSDTEVTVELEFDGTDFDTDRTLTFTVEADAIAGYNGTALTAQISVTANTESVVASTVAPLTEATLHESVVTLTLSGRTYEHSTFTIRDAVTVSGIAGVTVGTFDVDRVSDTQITVELTFNGNINADSTLTFTVGADAIAGYNGPALTVQVPVTATEQVLRAPSGISLIHVPLKVTAVDGVPKTIKSVGDLYNALGGVNTVNLLITYDPATQGWRSYLGESSRGTSADTVLADNQGIIADMKTPVSIRLRGDALGSNGSSFITLHPGTNLVGAPLRDSRITRVSDLFALEGIGGNVSTITVSNNGTFQMVKQAGDVGDIPITGGQSFILTAREATTVTISGQGWHNNPEMAAAAPVALTGIQVGDTTPVLALTGSIVPPVGEWGRIPHLRLGSGLRVIVKNRSTGRAVATMIGDKGERYQLTVVDTETGRAARIGDIFEISVRSPDPRIGVQPLRHTVTAEDVRQSRIQLPELTVYEIPAETELLRNYPNPFNPETWIPYRLAEDAVVNLTIYDTAGRVVRSIDVGYKPAAVYESRSKAIHWNGRNEFGEQVASGVYFYHLSAGDFSATRKMLIVK